MKSSHLLIAIGLALAATSAARAQDAGPTHVVTYVEVMPSAKADGATLVRQYRDASRKEEGNVRTEALRRIGQDNQFVIVEAWKDRNAFDAHGKSTTTTQFRDKLKTIQNAPYDERVHGALSAGPLGGGRLGGGAVYAVTHIDVIPPRKDDGTALVKQHGDDSRKDDGNTRFEILVQVNRPNHFTAVEIWRNRAAADAHGANAHVRKFREGLAPMSGALYDERFYKAM